MSDAFTALLLIWGASLVVLATALTLVMVTQGVSRWLRGAESNVSKCRAAAGRRLSSRHTQPV